MMENIIYNKNLRKIRRVKDLTQEYIAFKLGISQKAYSDIEQGKTKMREDLLLKLSSILEISPFEICTISCRCSSKAETKLNKLLAYLNSINVTIPKEVLED